MRKSLENPNVGSAPLALQQHELAAVAKTGCGTCHGAGTVTFQTKGETVLGPTGAVPAPPKRLLCKCVEGAVRGRADVQDIGGALHWLPRVEARS